MARYKPIDTSPRFLTLDLERQWVPGTFEHALNHLLDHQIDLTHFNGRFCNDDTVAATYPPAMLLKVVLFAYARGLLSSRHIAPACREQVTFIAHKTSIENAATTIKFSTASLSGIHEARRFARWLD